VVHREHGGVGLCFFRDDIAFVRDDHVRPWMSGDVHPPLTGIGRLRESVVILGVLTDEYLETIE